MESDLIERLREDCHPCCEVAADAAAEIEKLRKEIETQKSLVKTRQEALQRLLARIDAMGATK